MRSRFIAGLSKDERGTKGCCNIDHFNEQSSDWTCFLDKHSLPCEVMCDRTTSLSASIVWQWVSTNSSIDLLITIRRDDSFS